MALKIIAVKMTLPPPLNLRQGAPRTKARAMAMGVEARACRYRSGPSAAFLDGPNEARATRAIVVATTRVRAGLSDRRTGVVQGSKRRWREGVRGMASRVLLVDDEPTNLALLDVYLRPFGYDLPPRWRC